ncbi:MAG: iron ABC transporter permease [Alphaproteobacteria bacterium]|nr:iron ABC transporter permease [Alphaproteobacteria bacterium]
MTRAGTLSRRLTQQNVALALLLLLVGVLVLGPLLVLVRTSFAPAGTAPLETTVVTLDNYRAMLASPDTLVLLRNTLVYAVGSVTIAVALATAVAWLTERTDMPGQVLVRILMFSWMAVPPLVLGFGWILLINPGQGLLNVWARAWFGATDAPFTLYSMWTLIVITALAAVPTAFVMVSGLLRNIDPQLEQAGKVLGGSAWSVVRRITLPLLTPGILSVVIYMFMAVVQTFDLPLIIGLTARIPVLSTRVYLLSSPDRGIPNYGLSSTFGIFLLLLASLLMWGYLHATRVGERFRVVTGKGFRPRRLVLGPWRWPALGGVMLYFLVMLMPLLMLFWASLFPVYRTPSLDLLAGASFASYAKAIGSSMVQRAALNTVLLVVLSGTIVMALAALVGWFSVRGGRRIGRIVDILSFAPTAIPPVVMVVAILLLYLRTPLYGTIAILVIGHVSIYLAFGARTMVAAIMQIHKELGDAALTSGASWLTSMRRITLPLVWPHMLNGWLWVVAHSARDLTIPLTLMTASNMVIASALWMMWDFPDLPGAAALSMLLVLGSLLLVVPLQIVAGRATAAPG